MIKHALWEGLSGGQRAEMAGEAEALSDWKMSLDVGQRGTDDWLFEDDLTAADIEALVDTTGGVSWARDLDEEDWFLEHWLSGQT